MKYLALFLGLLPAAAWAAPDAPEGMVLVPAGPVKWGISTEEEAWRKAHALGIQRTALSRLASTGLPGWTPPAAGATAEEIRTALTEAARLLKSVADQTARDLGTVRTQMTAHPGDAYFRMRAAWLPLHLAALRRQETVLEEIGAALDLARHITTPDPEETGKAEIRVNAFYLDVHPVTVAQYRAFCKATGHPLPWVLRAADGEKIDWTKHPQRLFPEAADPSFYRPDAPVTGVTHADARAYAAWAGKRLPTESEWKLAASAGKPDALFPWDPSGPAGGNLGQPATEAANRIDPNLAVLAFSPAPDDGHVLLAPVRSFPANRLGLHDLGGNISEWCDGAPFYQPDLAERLAKRVATPPDPDAVRRWGSKASSYQPLCGANYRSPLYHALLSRRYGAPADHAHADRGFRCAKDVP